MVRITGGKWRGRRLEVPDGIRPTTELARKAAFDILGDAIRGARVLDACAGSGAYGLEALSRGAAHATFVEADRKVAEILRGNVERLGAGAAPSYDEASVARFSSKGEERTAARARPSAVFDVAFHDPPFKEISSESDLLSLLSLVRPAGLALPRARRRSRSFSRRSSPGRPAPLRPHAVPDLPPLTSFPPANIRLSPHAARSVHEQEPAPLHVRVRHRGASRQDRGPDLGLDPRRDPRRRPDGSRRVRDARHDGARPHRRRDHDEDLRRHPGHRAADDQGRRLHAREVRLRLRDVRRDLDDRQAVARHRDGRRHGRRGRSGPHVRPRHPRDRGAHAAPDHARPQAHAAPRRGAEEPHARVAAARREEPGHRGVRGRQAGARGHGRHLDPAFRVDPDARAPRGDPRGDHPSGRPGGPAGRQDEVPHQPDRPLRHGRARRATRG